MILILHEGECFPDIEKLNSESPETPGGGGGGMGEQRQCGTYVWVRVDRGGGAAMGRSVDRALEMETNFLLF